MNKNISYYKGVMLWQFEKLKIENRLFGMAAMHAGFT